MHQDASSGQEFQALRNWIIKDPDVVNQYLDTPLNQILNQLESEGFSGDQIWSDIVQHPGIDLSRYRALIAPTPTEEFLALTPHQLQESNEELADALLEMIRQQFEAIESDADVLETAGGTSTKVEHWKQHPGSTWKPNQNRSTAEKWEARGTDAAEVAVAVGVGAATYYAGKSIYSAGDRRGWWGPRRQIAVLQNKANTQFGQTTNLGRRVRELQDHINANPNDGTIARQIKDLEKELDINAKQLKNSVESGEVDQHLFWKDGASDKEKFSLILKMKSPYDQAAAFSALKPDTLDTLMTREAAARFGPSAYKEAIEHTILGGGRKIEFDDAVGELSEVANSKPDVYEKSLYNALSQYQNKNHKLIPEKWQNIVNDRNPYDIQIFRHLEEFDPGAYKRAYTLWQSNKSITCFNEGTSVRPRQLRKLRVTAPFGEPDNLRLQLARGLQNVDLNMDVKKFFTEDILKSQNLSEMETDFNFISQIEPEAKASFESSEFFKDFASIWHVASDPRLDAFSLGQSGGFRYNNAYKNRQLLNKDRDDEGFFKGADSDIRSKYDVIDKDIDPIINKYWSDCTVYQEAGVIEKLVMQTKANPSAATMDSINNIKESLLGKLRAMKPAGFDSVTEAKFADTVHKGMSEFISDRSADEGVKLIKKLLNEAIRNKDEEMYKLLITSSRRNGLVGEIDESKILLSFDSSNPLDKNTLTELDKAFIVAFDNPKNEEGMLFNINLGEARRLAAPNVATCFRDIAKDASSLSSTDSRNRIYASLCNVAFKGPIYSDYNAVLREDRQVLLSQLERIKLSDKVWNEGRGIRDVERMAEITGIGNKLENMPQYYHEILRGYDNMLKEREKTIRSMADIVEKNVEQKVDEIVDEEIQDAKAIERGVGEM